MISGLRNNPHLYEINLMSWLDDLSIRENRKITLRNIPRSEWRSIKGMGMDIVWLMGIWQRSPYSREKAKKEPSLIKAGSEILKEFTLDDIGASPYAVYDYEPDPSFGSFEELRALKIVLEEEGLLLLLDLVPNHTACDHPWIKKHPERYIQAESFEKGGCPEGFFLSEAPPGHKCIAHGRDPYFPPWGDTAQLNYSEDDTVAAMSDTLMRLTDYCHGLRCDMAMLLLKDVFLETWRTYLKKDSRMEEFWPFAIDRIRKAGIPFLLMAEAYWGKEDVLLSKGFDWVYDKNFYDLIVGRNIEGIKKIISKPADEQGKMVRFLENHDEERAVTALGPDMLRISMVIHSTLPGVRFWQHGQFEGQCKRVPVQMRRSPDGFHDRDLYSFSRKLLEEVNHPVFHDAYFDVLQTRGWPDNNSHTNLLAWCWERGPERRLIVVNFSPQDSQGKVVFPGEWRLTGKNLVLRDPIKGYVFYRDCADIEREGLYVALKSGEFHFFTLEGD